MNALDQEIAIAKVCGWTHTKTVHNPDPSAYGTHPIHTADVAWDLPLPDYLNDLNAMHEAEKTLTDHWDGFHFRNHIANNVSATARHDWRATEALPRHVAQRIHEYRSRI